MSTRRPGKINEIANFDFEQWAKDSGLTRKCTALLREEDLSKQVVLCMLTDTDIRGLGLSLVQTKLLQVAIRALHSQQSVCGETVKSVGVQSDQPAVPKGATSGDMSDVTASTGADVITPCDPTVPTDPRDAADQRPVTIADLRRQADNYQQLFGSGKDP